MANKELLISLGLDATSYTQGIQRVKNETRELDSEWKLASASSENFEESLDGIAKKQEYLAKRIELMSEASDIYSNRLKTVQENLLQQSESYQKLSEQLQKAKESQQAFNEGVAGAKDYSEVIKSLQQQVDKAGKAIVKCNKQILDSSKGYNEAQTSIQEMNKEIVKTQETLEHLGSDKSIESLIKSTEEIDHRFAMAREEIGKFEESLTGLATKQELLNEKSEVTYELLGEISGEINKSETAIYDYKVQIEGLSRELDNLLKSQEAMNFTDEGYDELKEKVQATRLEISKLTASLEFNEERTASLNDIYKNAELTLAQIAKESEIVSTSMREMIGDSVISNSAQEIDNLSKMEVELAQLESTINNTLASNVNMDKSLSGLNEKQQLYVESISKTESLMAEYQGKIDGIRSKLEGLQKEQLEIAQSSEVYAEKMKEAYASGNLEKVKELSNELSELKDKSKANNSAIKELSDSLKTTENRFSDLNSKLSRTQGNLTKTQENFKKLVDSAKLGTVVTQTENVDKVITKLENNITKATEKFKEFSNTNKGMENTFTGLAGKEEYLNKVILNSEKIQEEYNSRITESKVKIAELTKEYNSLFKAVERAEKSRGTGAGDTDGTATKKLQERLEALNEVSEKLKEQQAILNESSKGYDKISASLMKYGSELDKVEEKAKELSAVANFEPMVSSLDREITSIDALNIAIEEAVKNFNLLSLSNQEDAKSMATLGATQEHYTNLLGLTTRLAEAYKSEIIATKARTAELIEEQANLNKEIQKQINLFNRSGKAKKAGYSDSIIANKEKLAEVTSTIEKQKAKLESLENTYSTFDEKIAKVGSQLGKTSLEMKRMTENIGFQSLSKQVDKFANEEINTLNNKLKLLNTDFEETKAISTNLEGTFDGLNEKQSHYSSVLGILNEKQQIYNTSIEETMGVIAGLETSFSNLDKELQAREAYLKNNTDIANWEAEKEEMDSVVEKYKEVNTNLEAYKDHLLQLQSANEVNNSEILKTETVLSGVDTKFKELSRIKPFTALSEQVKNFSATVGEKLTQSIGEVNHKLQLFRDSSLGYSKGLQTIKTEQDLLGESLGLTKEKLAEYQSTLATTASKLDELKAREASLRAEILETREAMEISQGSSKDAQIEKLKTLETEYENLGKQIGNYTSKLKSEQSIVKETESSVAKQTAEINKLGLEYQKTSKQSFSYYSQLNRVNNELKGTLSVLDAQFEEAQSKSKRFGLSLRDLGTQTEYLKSKQEILKQSMANLGKQIALEGKELEEAKHDVKEFEDALAEMKVRLSSMETGTVEFEKLREAIARSEETLVEERNKVDSLNSSMNRMQSELSQTSAQFNILSRSVRTLPTNYIRNFGQTIASAGSKVRGIGYSFMTLSLAGGLATKAIIDAGAGYQKTLSEVQAVSGATANDMESISKRCTDLANSSIFNSTQIAQGYVYLAQAGYKVSDANRVIEDTLQVAHAGSMDLAQASSLAVDSIASMGYSAHEASYKMHDYLNIVAETANKTNSNVQQIMESFIKAGGEFKNLNMNMVDGASAIGVLANQGLKGSEAGQALNSILINMTKTGGESAKAMKELGVSMFDAQGKVKPFDQVILELSKKLSKLSPKKQVQILNAIGGKTNAKTLMKLMQGMTDGAGHFTKQYSELKQELEKAPNLNALTNMSNKMIDNFSGDVDKMKSKLHNFEIQLFDAMLPRLDATVKKISTIVTDLSNWFNQLSPKGKSMITWVITLTTVISPLLIILGTLGIVIGNIIKGLALLFKPLSLIFKLLKGVTKFKSVVSIIKGGVDTIRLALMYGMEWITGTLIPTLTGAMGWVTGTMIPAIVEAVLGLCATISTAFEGLAIAVGVSTGGLALIIGAVVVGITVAVAEIIKHWDGIKQYFSNWWAWVQTLPAKIKTGFNNWLAWIKTLPAKILSGLKSLKTKLAEWGSKLLEGIKKLPAKLGTWLIEGIHALIAKIIQILGLAVGTIIGTIVNIGQGIVGVIKGYLSIFKGIFDMVIGLVTLNGNKIKKGFKEIGTGILKIVGSIAKTIIKTLAGLIINIGLIFGVNLRGVFHKAYVIVENWIKSVKTAFSNWWAWISKFPAKIGAFFKGIGNSIKASFNNWWAWVKTIPSKIKGVLDSAFNYVKQIPSKIKGVLETIGLAVGAFFLVTGAKIVSSLSSAYNAVTSALSNAYSAVTGWISSVVSAIANFCELIVSNPRQAFNEMVSAISGACHSAYSAIANWVSSGISAIRNFGSNLVSSIESAMSSFSNIVSSKCHEVVQWFLNMPSEIANVGARMVDSIKSGFESAWGSFSGWVSKAIHNVTHPFSGAVIVNHKTMPNLHKGFMGFASVPNSLNVQKPLKANQTTPNYSGTINNSFLGFSSLLDSLQTTVSDSLNMSAFKTDGGFYKPQKMSPQIVVENKNNNDELLKLLLQQNQMLMAMMTNNIEVGVSIDGRQVAKASAKYMNSELDMLNKRKMRLGGSF